MDIQRVEAPFVPVNITLGTQEELDTLITCLAIRMGGFRDALSVEWIQEHCKRADYDTSADMYLKMKAFVGKE